MVVFFHSPVERENGKPERLGIYKDNELLVVLVQKLVKMESPRDWVFTAKYKARYIAIFSVKMESPRDWAFTQLVGVDDVLFMRR